MSDHPLREEPEGGVEPDPVSVDSKEKGRGRGARKVAIRVAQLTLTVIVTWFILDRVGVSLDEVRALELEDWRPDWLLLLLSCLVLLVGYFISAAFWGRMVRELGGPRLPLLVSSRIYFLSNLVRYIPGKIWQLAGLAYLARREGVPATVATGTAILGHGMALGAAAMIGTGALFASGQNVLGIIALLVAIFPLLLFAYPPLFEGVVRRGFRYLGQEAPPRFSVNGWFGIRWLALYVLNWAVYSFGFWILVRAFHLGGNPLEVASAFSAAYLYGYLAIFAPAGIGVREGLLITLLQPIHGVGAVGIAVIARLWTVAVELVPALAFAGEAAAGRQEIDRSRVNRDRREEG